jgi:hypothetical protein
MGRVVTCASPVVKMTDTPLRLSWSRIKEYELCAARPQLKALGKRSPITDIRVFFPGTVADRCMRAYLEAEEQVPGHMARTAREIMDREEETAKATGDGVVKWKSPKDREETLERIVRCVTRLEPILAEYVVPYNYQPAVRFEVPFDVPYQGGTRQILLVGEMDLLVQCTAEQVSGVYTEAGTRIWDLKMTENNDYWRQTYPQLTFYEIAAFGMKLGWAKGSGLIQPLCDQQVLPFVFSLDQHREMMGRIVRAAEGWWRGDFGPKAGSHCYNCPVLHACPITEPLGRRMPIRGISSGGELRAA